MILIPVTSSIKGSASSIKTACNNSISSGSKRDASNLETKDII